MVRYDRVAKERSVSRTNDALILFGGKVVLISLVPPALGLESQLDCHICVLRACALEPRVTEHRTVILVPQVCQTSRYVPRDTIALNVAELVAVRVKEHDVVVEL